MDTKEINEQIDRVITCIKRSVTALEVIRDEKYDVGPINEQLYWAESILREIKENLNNIKGGK